MSTDDLANQTNHENQVQVRDEPSTDAKTWGMLCHLSAFGGYVFPFGNIIGPLIVWQLKKDQYEFVDDQGKESMNFQITIAIASVICIVLCIVVVGFFLLPLVVLFNLVMKIVAAVKASNGERFRYPLSIRLIK